MFLVRPANAMWVCIDFEIARWKFDIDSKWSNFFLQENEHTFTHTYTNKATHTHTYTWTQSNSLTHSFSCCRAQSHSVFHIELSVGLQSMCIVELVEMNNRCENTFSREEKSKWFCTHVPRNKHTHKIIVHLERGHHVTIHTLTPTHQDGKCVCVWWQSSWNLYICTL